MPAEVHSHEVIPAHGRGELRGVASVALAILLAWAGGIALRHVSPAPPTLASHQQDAFTGLNAQEQGLFNDLRSAAEEIRALHTQNKIWPEPAVLAVEAIPPFIQDAVWQQRGRVEWQRLDAHAPTHAVYWGRNASIEWALVLSGETTAVWRRAPKPDGAIPQAIPEMLVLDSWIEFVPRNAKAKSS